MTKLQNRSVAVLITACVIVLSSLLGTGTTLSDLRREANRYYNDGYFDEVRGIRYDLSQITNESYNLVTVAERYLGKNDASIGAVQRSIEELSISDKPPGKHAAAEELHSALTALDTALRTEELSDEDKGLQDKLIANIEGSYRRIAQSAYNDEASRFNGILQQYPARLLAGVLGIEPLELYA